MAKRQTPSPAEGDVELMQTLREAAQHVWLAGITALVKTQEEGVKVFDALRTEGRQGGRAARKRLSGFSENVGRATRGATATAARFEQLLEARIARGLQRLGVPTAKDMQRIADRLDALEGRLVRKPTKRAAAAAGTSRTGVRRTRAAKPATTKRPGAKTK